MKWYLRNSLKGDNQLVLWCNEWEAIDTAKVVSRSIKQHVWLIDAHDGTKLFVGPLGVLERRDG